MEFGFTELKFVRFSCTDRDPVANGDVVRMDRVGVAAAVWV